MIELKSCSKCKTVYLKSKLSKNKNHKDGLQ